MTNLLITKYNDGDYSITATNDPTDINEGYSSRGTLMEVLKDILPLAHETLLSTTVQLIHATSNDHDYTRESVLNMMTDREMTIYTPLVDAALQEINS